MNSSEYNLLPLRPFMFHSRYPLEDFNLIPFIPSSAITKLTLDSIIYYNTLILKYVSSLYCKSSTLEKIIPKLGTLSLKISVLLHTERFITIHHKLRLSAIIHDLQIQTFETCTKKRTEFEVCRKYWIYSLIRAVC